MNDAITAAGATVAARSSRLRQFTLLCAATVFAVLCGAGFAQLASRRPASIAAHPIASHPIAAHPIASHP